MSHSFPICTSTLALVLACTAQLAAAQRFVPSGPAGASVERPTVAESTAVQLPARLIGTAEPAATAAAVSMRAYEVHVADVRLVASMQRWAAMDGVRLRWDADKHVLITAPMTFQARSAFDAIAQVLSTSGIRNGSYPLEVCEYPNQPALLRITRQGEQAKDCPQ